MLGYTLHMERQRRLLLQGRRKLGIASLHLVPRQEQGWVPSAGKTRTFICPAHLSGQYDVLQGIRTSPPREQRLSLVSRRMLSADQHAGLLRPFSADKLDRGGIVICGEAQSR